jgi:type I restriction enzyme, S subunit
MRLVPLSELMADKVVGLDPSRTPEETFELWSIPSYDEGLPDVVLGSDIGSAKKCVAPDDVLLSRIVPHIRRSWIVAPKANYRQIASGEWIVFRDKRFVPAYLRHFLISDPFHAQFMSTVAGVGGSLLRARPDGVAKIEIPLPPLEEQRRIAAILDQADALRRKRREALELLKRIERSAFVDFFTSKKLNTAPLGDLIHVSSGDGLTAENQRGGEFPVYGGNGINGWHNEFNVAANTITIGRVGAYCGAVHVTARNSWVTDNALIVRNKTDLLRNSYLAAALAHANLNQYAGRSSQPLISGSRLYPIEIVVPSTTDQIRFEQILNQALSFWRVYSNQSKQLEALFASLQHRAFRGEL